MDMTEAQIKYEHQNHHMAEGAEMTPSQLVQDYDLIAHEDLRIGNMSRSASGTVEAPGTNVKQKSGLNKSIMDAAWGQLIGNYIHDYSEKDAAECNRMKRG